MESEGYFLSPAFLSGPLGRAASWAAACLAWAALWASALPDEFFFGLRSPMVFLDGERLGPALVPSHDGGAVRLRLLGEGDEALNVGSGVIGLALEDQTVDSLTGETDGNPRDLGGMEREQAFRRAHQGRLAKL